MIFSKEARRILQDFAEAYPVSAYYKGGRKLRRATLNALFPEMEIDVDIKEAVLGAVEELVKAGIISVKWKRFREGDEPEALYLEDAEKLYAALGSPSPKALTGEMLSIIRERLSAHENRHSGSTVGKEKLILEGILAELRADIPPPCGSMKDLGDALALFRASRAETESRTLRNLSIRLFNESKRIEEILPLADQLGKKYLGTAISADLELKRSFPEVSFIFFGRIKFADGREWEGMGCDLSLPLRSIASIRNIDLKNERVLTIENKETFYAFTIYNNNLTEKSRFSCVVYTGGYANNAVRKFLEIMVAGGARVSHFGDMDPEGLLIFQDIDRITNGGLSPFCMDAGIYRRYMMFGSPFSETMRMKLDRIEHPRLLLLAKEMRRTGIGVEQEVVSFESDEHDPNPRD